MKINALFITMFILLATAYAQGQSQPSKIAVQVYVQTPGQTVKTVAKGASVFIPAVAECVTDDKGICVLNLSKCVECLPGQTLTIRVNSKDGLAETPYTLKNNSIEQNCDLTILKTNQVYITGIVRELGSGNFLENVTVGAIISDYPDTKPSSVTDTQGVFQMALRKDGITEQKAVKLNFSIPGGQHQDHSEVVFISQYAPIEVFIARKPKGPAEEARTLMAQEVMSNLRKLDQRLQLVAYNLKLNAEEGFSTRFDSVMRHWAPGIDPDPKSSLRALTVQTNIASLRQALNALPLRGEFSPMDTRAFEMLGLTGDASALTGYLDQFGEVNWAEEQLFNAMNAYANGHPEKCPALTRRIGLAWVTFRNRTALFHLHALRLLDALAIPTTTSATALSSLKTLSPKMPLAQDEFLNRLSAKGLEMALLVKEKAKVISEIEKCRDKALKHGIDAIDSMLTIRNTDTWQEVVIKARALREIGRVQEAIDAFMLYGDMFGETDSTAMPYSRMAVRLTNHANRLEVNGGLFVYNLTPGSHIRAAGINLHDILISINGQPVNGMDEVQKLFFPILIDTPIQLGFLRWDAGTHAFQRLSVTIPSKPMGGDFIPI